MRNCPTRRDVLSGWNSQLLPVKKEGAIVEGVKRARYKSNARTRKAESERDRYAVHVGVACDVARRSRLPVFQTYTSRKDALLAGGLVDLLSIRPSECAD